MSDLVNRISRWLDGRTDDASGQLLKEAQIEINAMSMLLMLADSALNVAVATEREECAKACDAIRVTTGSTTAKECANAIRARSKNKSKEQQP